MRSRIQWLNTAIPTTAPERKLRKAAPARSATIIDHLRDIRRRWDHGFPPFSPPSIPMNMKTVARSSRRRVAISKTPTGTFGARGLAAIPIAQCPIGPITFHLLLDHAYSINELSETAMEVLVLSARPATPPLAGPHPR